MRGKTTAFLFAVLIGIASVGAFISPLGQSWELGTLDIWFQLRGPVPPPKDVVLIALDEQSYSELKVPLNQPWPRSLQALLTEQLSRLGAKRVVFDILFLDPGSDLAADNAFAKALATTSAILGADSVLQRIRGAGGGYLLEELDEPYEPLLKAAAGIGLVGLPVENGAIRNFLTARTERTREVPSLAEAAAGVSRDNSALLPGARDLIHYYGPSRTIRTYPVYELLRKEKAFPAERIKDKVVFVGLVLRSEVGPAQKDVFHSPFGGAGIFGAEIHATAAANLIEQSWIRRFGFTTEIVAVFLTTFAVATVLLLVNPIIGLIITGTAIFLWALTSFLLFRNGWFVPGVVPIVIATPLILLGSTLYYYFVVRRSAQQMQSAFELYLSPQMAKELGTSKSVATLGGEKLWCTALFTDIAGFTAITEEMPAEKVSEMLNAYFTEVMEVVFQNQGTLIKFIGDAVFVLWGAPIKVSNHAELAIKTGLAINREVDRFNRSGRFPALRTRVGIHTGPMVVGNLGSKKRFDYTAIGDSVNLASRVEGLNKYFGTWLLFTDSTKKDAGNSIEAVKVGAVQVAGKKEVINLYTAFSEPIPSKDRDLWSEAFALFENRKFLEASALLDSIPKESLLFEIGIFYRSQCTSYLKTPPPEKWSGEIRFESK